VNAGVLALQDLGKAVKEAAGVPADLSLRLQRAQNTADIARADVIMRDAFASHQDRMQGMPETQWEETWKTEGLKSVREQIDNLGLSQAARDQLTPDLIQWEGATSIQVRTQATKQTIGNNRLAVKNAVDRAVLDGDFELAISHYKNGVSSALFSPEEGDAGIVEIEERVKAKAKEDQASGIASAIETDPGSAIPELEKAARGEPNAFGEGIEPLKAKRFLSMAQREDKNRKVELRVDLHNRIISGDILDPETLRKESGGKLDEKTLKSLEKIMGKEIPFDPETFSKLRTQIVAYNASTDQDGSKLNEIMTGIETTVPQNRQGPLNSELSQSWNATVRDGKKRTVKAEALSSMEKMINDMTSEGVLGQYKTGKGDDAKYDEAKRAEVWIKAETLKQGMRDFSEANPDATPAEFQSHFQSLAGAEAAASVQAQIMEDQASSKATPFWGKTMFEMATGDDFQAGLSGDLIERVKGMEGFFKEAYQDSGQVSIGYGTKGKLGETLEPAEAEARLRDELAGHAKRVDAAARRLGVQLTKGQRDALISFDFNTGAGPKVLESKTPEAIAKRMQLYIYEDPKRPPSRGLINRRAKEMEIWNQ
jgi:GH24 family phage-related lysozyme (muramidase)